MDTKEDAPEIDPLTTITHRFRVDQCMAVFVRGGCQTPVSWKIVRASFPNRFLALHACDEHLVDVLRNIVEEKFEVVRLSKRIPWVATDGSGQVTWK